MNYYISAATARRYARARPDLSPLFNPRLRQCVGPVRRALDVGCGTGMSSRALAEMAPSVIGLDPSPAMLAYVQPQAGVRYVAGQAETLPFADAAFDLLGAGLAFHWFDRQAFLREAARVLQPGRWLLIYNTWFCGTMQDDPAFAAWWRGTYLARFPNPPRQSDPITAEQAAAADFELGETWTIEHDVALTPERLAEYFTTQSNITVALRRSGQTLEAVTAWLEDELAGLFIQPVEHFPFAGSAVLLHRQASARTSR